MTNPFTLISTREVYKNPWMSLREDRVTKDGKEGYFGVTSLGSGVGVIALDNENNICLVREFKYALGRENINLPGGGIEGDETPLDAAKRELREELGIEAQDWISLGLIHPLTTIISQTEYIFLARDISYVERSEDSWEDTSLIKIPYIKALEMVMNSEITHGATVAGILKAQKYITKN